MGLEYAHYLRPVSLIYFAFGCQLVSVQQRMYKHLMHLDCLSNTKQQRVGAPV